MIRRLTIRARQYDRVLIKIVQFETERFEMDFYFFGDRLRFRKRRNTGMLRRASVVEYVIERMQTILTSPLVLEPLTVAHAEEMFDVLSDLNIYRYIDCPPPPSVKFLRDLYSRLETRQSPDGKETWLNWVVRIPDHPPVGYVQATIFTPGSAWIAYVLSSKHWGRGYALTATHAMLQQLATTYGVWRYLATVEVGNQRSIRLLERLDFRLVTLSEASGHSLSASERLYVRLNAENIAQDRK